MATVQKVKLDDAGKALKAESDRQVKALKKAAVRTLTRAAGIAQDSLLATFARDFKAPTPFTTATTGYRLRLATMGQDNPTSAFVVKPRQAAYLDWTIRGGVRQGGDSGASDKYIFLRTKKTDAGWSRRSGALERYYTRRLVSEGNRKRPTRGGGVYFGKVDGHEADDQGFILRPARSQPLYKLDLKGKKHLARPKLESLQVKDAGDPAMLVKAAVNTIHRGFIPYEVIMEAAMGEAVNDMERRLFEELAKQ